MTVKQSVISLGMVMFAIALIDFVARLTFSSVTPESTNMTVIGQKTQTYSSTHIDLKAMEALLGWSDVKPTAVAQKPAPVKPANIPAPVEVKKPDIRQMVKRAIQGDASKYLHGDELLSLKGVFYDGRMFASVELEDVNSKSKQYLTLTQDVNLEAAKDSNAQTAGYQLVEIEKYHIVLTKNSVRIRLEMFQ
jgi:hypothetical protein